MIRYLLAVVLLCSTVPAMAQRGSPPPQTGRPCLRPINLHGWQAVPGNRSVVVQDRSRQRFRVNFMSECRNMHFERRLQFRTRGTGRLTCVASGDSLRFRDPTGPGICNIQSVEFQTPELDQQDAAAAATANRR